MGQISRRGVEGSPTLLVEVLSPSTRNVDRIAKFALYAGYGVSFDWIVDPEQRDLTVFRLDGTTFAPAMHVTAGDVVGPPPFPALRFALDVPWP